MAPFLALIAVCLGGFGWYLNDSKKADSKYVVLVGRSSQQVLTSVGSPRFKVKMGDPNYPILGYGRPSRAQYKNCWIFFYRDRIAYVYFDKSDKVDEVFIGGG